MGVPLPVDVGDRIDQLGEVAPDAPLGQLVLLPVEVLQQLATLQQLQHEIDVVGVLQQLDEPHHVRVALALAQRVRLVPRERGRVRMVEEHLDGEDTVAAQPLALEAGRVGAGPDGRRAGQFVLSEEGRLLKGNANDRAIMKRNSFFF